MSPLVFIYFHLSCLNITLEAPRAPASLALELGRWVVSGSLGQGCTGPASPQTTLGPAQALQGGRSEGWRRLTRDPPSAHRPLWLDTGWLRGPVLAPTLSQDGTWGASARPTAPGLPGGVRERHPPPRLEPVPTEGAFLRGRGVRREPPACLVPCPAVGASRPGGHSPDVALIKQSFSFVRGLQW